MDADLAARRKNSPITQARAVAFQLMAPHTACLRDGVPLEDFIEDMAQAILKGTPVPQKD